LKRVAPFWTSASDEDKKFVSQQLSKAVMQPLKDYLATFEKFKSLAQNTRNLRATVP
jgi:hypothetical protein